MIKFHLIFINLDLGGLFVQAKSIYMILIIVVMLLVFGVTSLNNLSNLDPTVKFGKAEFTIPDNYYKKDIGSDEVVITDGDIEITLLSYDDKNVKKHIEKYESYLKGKNKTLNMKDFKVDGVHVYKGTINGSSKVIHYWFVKDGKTYSIYSSNADKNTGDTILNIIKSYKKN